MEEIVRFLEAHEDDNFIECHSVKTFEKRNDIFFPRIVIGRKMWQQILKNVLIYGTGGWNYTFSIIKRSAPYDIHYFFGSSWWCLNHNTVMWIEEYLQHHPKYQTFFEGSLCADECFFQTLVMNSPFSDNVKKSLCYIKWLSGKSSPEILTTNDFDGLIKSNKMIARKFDIDIDSRILEELKKVVKM